MFVISFEFTDLDDLDIYIYINLILGLVFYMTNKNIMPGNWIFLSRVQDLKRSYASDKRLSIDTVDLSPQKSKSSAIDRIADPHTQRDIPRFITCIEHHLIMTWENAGRSVSGPGKVDINQKMFTCKNKYLPSRELITP